MDAEAIFREHYPGLYRYLAHLTGDADLAADAAQEAFVRMLERTPREAEAKAWLFKVATNFARQSGRTRGRRLRLLRDAPLRAPCADEAAGADDRVDIEERAACVRRRLQQLTERERTILLMREEGFSHAEIAVAVGTTTGAVGTLFVRALRKLSTSMSVERRRWA